MPKPSVSPTWSTDATFVAPGESFDATVTKVEPTSGKKAEGWEPKEKPAAQYLNYWMNLVYLWIEWLKSLAEPVVWTDVLPRGELTQVEFDNTDAYYKVLATAPAAPGIGLIPVELKQGQMIDRIRGRFIGTGAGAIVLNLIKTDGSGAPTPIAQMTINSPPASWTVTEFSLATPHTVDWTDGAYYFGIVFDTVGQGVTSVGHRTAAPT